MTRLGTPRLHMRQIDSTNLRARELASSGAPHGTLVTAGEQVSGRGRQGRQWSSPPGTSLSMSLVVREPPRLLSLAAGLAVAETVDTMLVGPEQQGQPAQIKWPNDVLVDGLKVSGILVEGRPMERWAVLGVGLNVAVPQAEFPGELRDRAGTLGLDAADVERTLTLLLQALERWLSAPEDELLAGVRERDALLGEPVSWAGGSGIAAGIDASGRLLVDLYRDDPHLVADGAEVRVALDAGEVHLSRRGSGV